MSPDVDPDDQAGFAQVREGQHVTPVVRPAARPAPQED